MELSPAGPARFLQKNRLIAVPLVVLLIAASIVGAVWAIKTPVTLVVDGEADRLRTGATDVASLLEEAGIVLADGDLVNPPLDEPLTRGSSVTVRHAVPVTIDLGEEHLELTVVGSTVADALVCAGLDLGNGLAVDPAVDVGLEPGMTIVASDVFLRVTEEETEIPFEIEIVEDEGLPTGARRVRTVGAPGRLLRIFEAAVTDGAEGARVLKAERVLEQPITEIVAVGTRHVPMRVPVSRGAPREVPPAPTSGVKLTMVASAYTPGVGCGYRTATGVEAGFGIVAVDPAVIPLGTRIYVPGYGFGVAADTGAAISGDRIDLCFDTLSQALAWGRRTVTITVVD